MIGIGTQEIGILLLVSIPALIIFALGYYVGKSRGFKKGLEYANSLKSEG